MKTNNEFLSCSSKTTTKGGRITDKLLKIFRRCTQDLRLMLRKKL